MSVRFDFPPRGLSGDLCGALYCRLSLPAACDPSVVAMKAMRWNEALIERLAKRCESRAGEIISAW